MFEAPGSGVSGALPFALVDVDEGGRALLPLLGALFVPLALGPPSGGCELFGFDRDDPGLGVLVGARTGEFRAEPLESGRAPSTGDDVADAAPFRLERTVVSIWPGGVGIEGGLSCMVGD